MSNRVKEIFETITESGRYDDHAKAVINEWRDILISATNEISKVIDGLPPSILEKNIRYLSYEDIDLISNRLKMLAHVDVRMFAPGFDPALSASVKVVTLEIANDDRDLVQSGIIKEMYSFNWFCAAFLGNAQFNIAGKGDLGHTLYTYTQSNIDYCFKIAKSNVASTCRFMYGFDMKGKKPSGCLVLLIALPICMSLIGGILLF